MILLTSWECLFIPFERSSSRSGKGSASSKKRSRSPSSSPEGGQKRSRSRSSSGGRKKRRARSHSSERFGVTHGVLDTRRTSALYTGLSDIAMWQNCAFLGTIHFLSFVLISRTKSLNRSWSLFLFVSFFLSLCRRRGSSGSSHSGSSSKQKWLTKETNLSKTACFIFFGLLQLPNCLNSHWFQWKKKYLRTCSHNLFSKVFCLFF